MADLNAILPLVVSGVLSLDFLSEEYFVVETA
jgi:hypothetical protein